MSSMVTLILSALETRRSDPTRRLDKESGMTAAPASAPVSLDKLPLAEAIKGLGVDPKTGLTSAEAQSRIAKYGPNALEEKKKNQWAVLLDRKSTRLNSS